MKNLFTKNLNILSMPWMRVLKITHLQGKNPRKRYMKRVTKPLKRSKNHLTIPPKTMNI
jgi:hypothetical protein